MWPSATAWSARPFTLSSARSSRTCWPPARSWFAMTLTRGRTPEGLRPLMGVGRALPHMVFLLCPRQEHQRLVGGDTVKLDVIDLSFSSFLHVPPRLLPLPFMAHQPHPPSTSKGGSATAVPQPLQSTASHSSRPSLFRPPRASPWSNSSSSGSWWRST